MPKQSSELAHFIATRINRIRHLKSQKQVAQEAGFDSVNFVSMLKRGDAKLPIDRVSSFAIAVDCDPRELMAITLRAHFGARVAQEIVDLTGDTLTANERAGWFRFLCCQPNGQHFRQKVCVAPRVFDPISICIFDVILAWLVFHFLALLHGPNAGSAVIAGSSECLFSCGCYLQAQKIAALLRSY